MSADRRSFPRDQRGSTAAEFAIVLPVLVLMIMSVIQFGWAQHASGSVGYAMEKASRSLILNPALDQAAVQALVLADLDGDFGSRVTVTMVKEAGAGGATYAKITGVYNGEIGLPGLAAMPFKSTRVVVTPLPEVS